MTSIPFHSPAIEPGANRRRFAPRAVQAARDAALKLAGVCAALLAAAGFLLPAPERAAPSAPVTVRAGWVEIAKPATLFSFSAPQLGREKSTYAARRHESGGGREDSLTVGEFGGGRAFLRLSVYRHGAEKAAEAPFYVEMARRAAPLGLSIVHASLEQDQPSRFGSLETAALSLSLSQGEMERGACRGFRLVHEAPGLTIAGLACPGANEALSAADLACLVDRLEWIGASDDQTLRAFFTARPVRASGCGEIAVSEPAPVGTKRGRRH